MKIAIAGYGVVGRGTHELLLKNSGLEPTASWSRTKHATKLRYTPALHKIL